MTDFLSIEKQMYVNRTMDGLFNEVSLLREWFKKEFSECDLRIHVDLNKITLLLSIDVRVMTSKEVTELDKRGKPREVNQGFFECPIRISEKQFMNDRFMTPFLRSFNDELRKNISQSVNNHLIMERLKNVE